MSREMSVDRDSLVNQALFTFARLNGYITPGSVAPHAVAPAGPSATAVPPVVQPLASPPNAIRRVQEPPPTAMPEPVSGVQAVSAQPEPNETPPETASSSTSLNAFSPEAAPPSAKAPPSSGPAEEGTDGLELLPDIGAVEWRVPPNVLTDPRVIVVRGEVVNRDFQGTVKLCGEANVVLRELELGPEPDEARIESVLVDETRTPSEWKKRAEALSREGHLAEALLALVRAVGSGEPDESLRGFLEQHTLRRTELWGHQRADSAASVVSNMHRFGAQPSRKASYLVDEIRQGAFVPSILKELAIDQDQYASSRAAADIIRCAKALDRTNPWLYAYTQALIEVSLGHPEAALTAADELRVKSSEQASFLTAYVGALFPDFDYWPARDGVTALKLAVEAKPSVRTLADFRDAIVKAALRVRALRDVLVGLADSEARWLPPTLEALIAKSKATLAAGEEIALEEWQTRSIPQLLRKLRSEWARLCWLCWLAGLDAVSVPQATSKPRAPSVVGHALTIRAHLFFLRGEERPLEEGFDPGELDEVRAVAAVPWNGASFDSLEPANASELGGPEVQTVLEAFAWAGDPTVTTPFGQTADGEAASNETPATRAPEVEVAASVEPVGALPTEPGLGPPSTEAAPSRKSASRLGNVPAIDESHSNDRTAIVQTNGHRLWVTREGHKPLELSGLRFTVGRDPRCDVVIASPRVSREHASIVVENGSVLVTDLSSSNGTYFNGERIERHLVSDGDVVQFGNEKVAFHFSPPT